MPLGTTNNVQQDSEEDLYHRHGTSRIAAAHGTAGHLPQSKSSLRRQELARALEEMQHTVNELESQESERGPGTSSMAERSSATGSEEDMVHRSEVEVLRRQVARLQAQMELLQADSADDRDWDSQAPPSYASEIRE